MFESLLLKKKNENLNLFITFLFFGIVYLFYLYYPPVSSKGYVMVRAMDGRLSSEYGLWGYLNEYSFKYLSYIFGNLVNDFLLMQLILGFQVALVWSLCVYQILKKLNYYTIIVLCHPFILGFFGLCIRDALSVGLILLLFLKGFDKIKIFLSIFISFAIHKGTLPLIFLASLFSKLNIESKKFYLFCTLFSIFSTFSINYLLRHTDISELVPDFLYGNIFYYPRISFLNPNLDFYSVGLVNNIYGNINLKLLLFGVLGQLACTYFKNYFHYKTFYLAFSTFFICSFFSSVPNANRFVYHSYLISFPFLFDIFLLKMKNFIKNIQ